MKKFAGCVLTLGLLLAGVYLKAKAQQDKALYAEEVKLISFEDLAYPPIARVTRVQGIVVVNVQLDEKGNVAAASAIAGPRPLIPDCLSNVKKWKFKPNLSKRAVIVYEFRLDDGACHDASHSLFRLIHPNFASITACSPVIVG